MIADFDTSTWNDPWYHSLSQEAKLLFIYLWTNDHKNNAGLYVIMVSTIANETGFTSEQVTALLAELSPKVMYDPDSHIVWVVNHFKKQFLKTGNIVDKMIKNIEKALLSVPEGHPFVGQFISRYSTVPISYPFPIKKPSPDTLHIPSIEGITIPSKEGPVKVKVKVKDEVRGGVRGGELSTAPAPEPTEAPVDPMPPSGPASLPPEPNGPAGAKALFTEFWDAYPARNGKKLQKAEAFRRFCLIPAGERCVLIQAARHYAASQQVRDGIGIRDAPNFIADGSGRPYWRDWTEPERPPPTEAELEAERSWKEREKREKEARARKATLLKKEAEGG